MDLTRTPGEMSLDPWGANANRQFLEKLDSEYNFIRWCYLYGLDPEDSESSFQFELGVVESMPEDLAKAWREEGYMPRGGGWAHANRLAAYRHRPLAKCHACGGSGWAEARKSTQDGEPCEMCRGTGEIA